MNPKEISFTKHALKRARERHLWKYVNKEKFFYDAKHKYNNLAELGDCVYVYKYQDSVIKIMTMYHI